MSDLWQWVATYKGGEEYSEFADDGESRGFATVDIERLAMLELRRSNGEGDGITVLIPEGARPILLRRRRIDFNPDTGEQEPVRTITIVGFQTGNKYKNFKAVLGVYDDGSMMLVDDVDALV